MRKYLTILLFLIPLTLSAEPLVIGNSSISITTASKGEVRQLFLRYTNTLKGHYIKHVYVQPLTSPTTERFCKAILGITPEKFFARVKELQDSSRSSAPLIIPNELTLKSRVDLIPNSIGYISSTTLFLIDSNSDLILINIL